MSRSFAIVASLDDCFPLSGGPPRGSGGLAFAIARSASSLPLTGVGDSFESLDGSTGVVSLGFSCAGDSFESLGARSRLTVAWPTPITFAIARWLASIFASGRWSRPGW